MRAAGTAVSTTIELRRLDRASAAAVALRTVCAGNAYKSATVGEGVYQFSRVYRPRWATISGWALTIGLLGAGYWLLLIRRTESCTMWVNEDRATVKVTLAGGLLPEVYACLCSTFDELESTPGPSSDVNDSEREAFDQSDDFRAYRAFRSFPKATPVDVDLTALELEEIEESEEVEKIEAIDHIPTNGSSPLPSTNVLDLPEVRFETGEQVRVMGVVYVGHDPMQCDANGRAVQRLAVADATGTIAKTHFAMGADLAGLWVEDLFSGTGTSVGVDAQSARRARPLERTPVAAGETIFFGDLSALVLASGDRTAVIEPILSPPLWV